jgi:hypothetical protein
MPIETQHRHASLSKHVRPALALAAVVVGLLLAVPGAQAATYCVGAPTDCSGMDYPGNGGVLQEVLDLAAANGEPDVVRIGAGTYTPGEPGGWEFDDVTNGIDIRGEGPTETILEASDASQPTLKLTGAGGFSSGLTDLGLRLSPGGGTPTGLVLAGAGAANVAVTAPDGLSAGLGVRLAGDASFDHGSVDVPGLTGIEAIGNSIIAGTSITAGVGLKSTTGILEIFRSRIDTDRIGVISSVPTSIFDTLIHVRDGAGIEYGLLGTGDVTAAQLTVVGSASPSYGVRAFRLGGGSALHELDNSTVTGFDNDLSAASDGLSLAGISVAYSNYSSTLVSPGGTITPGAGNIDVAPGFANAAVGDFHLRHDSPLIDGGHDLGFGDEADLDLLQRNVDGDASGDPEPDIGAYEYQRAAPVAAISGPDSATVGQTLELSGAGSSDADVGDALTYDWSFGDGTTATGESASHAYAAPGTYAVTLQVTDPTGQQGTVTKEISVQAAGGSGQTGGGVPTGDPGDLLAPVISRLRVARAGRAIRFRLSEPARVTLRLTRAGTRRLAGRIRVNGRLGANEVRLRGRRLGGRVLRPGRYRVAASARDAAGNQARPRTARLVLLRQ